jgi:hypothetical protein
MWALGITTNFKKLLKNSVSITQPWCASLKGQQRTSVKRRSTHHKLLTNAQETELIDQLITLRGLPPTSQMLDVGDDGFGDFANAMQRELTACIFVRSIKLANSLTIRYTLNSFIELYGYASFTLGKGVLSADSVIWNTNTRLELTNFFLKNTTCATLMRRDFSETFVALWKVLCPANTYFLVK